MLTWLLAALTLTLFIVAVATLHFMRAEANKRLATGNQLSYFLPMMRWDQVTVPYKRLYPQGHAYLVWQVSVFGTVASAAIIILIQVWQIIAGNR
jgi:hypothetical protein